MTKFELRRWFKPSTNYPESDHFGGHRKIATVSVNNNIDKLCSKPVRRRNRANRVVRSPPTFVLPALYGLDEGNVKSSKLLESATGTDSISDWHKLNLTSLTMRLIDPCGNKWRILQQPRWLFKHRPFTIHFLFRRVEQVPPSEREAKIGMEHSFCLQPLSCLELAESASEFPLSCWCQYARMDLSVFP